jgi:hypothetical protein
MSVQTAFGRSVAAVVESEFLAASGVQLKDIEEPTNASYIKVVFGIGNRRVLFKIAPEKTQTEPAIRDAVQRHIAFARRKRKALTR